MTETTAFAESPAHAAERRSDTAQVPIYRYTITLADGTRRYADAAGYEEDGAWWHFDDTTGTVLTLRHALVHEVTRGEQVGEQEVDAL